MFFALSRATEKLKAGTSKLATWFQKQQAKKQQGVSQFNKLDEAMVNAHGFNLFGRKDPRKAMKIKYPRNFRRFSRNRGTERADGRWQSAYTVGLMNRLYPKSM